MNNIQITPEILNAIYVGIFAPPLAAFLSKCSWPSWAKAGLCFGVAVVFATVQNWNNLKAEDWIGSLVAVMVTAQTWYSMVWKPLGVTNKLQNFGPIKDKPWGELTAAPAPMPAPQEPLTPAQKAELENNGN